MNIKHITVWFKAVCLHVVFSIMLKLQPPTLRAKHAGSKSKSSAQGLRSSNTCRALPLESTDGLCKPVTDQERRDSFSNLREGKKKSVRI